MTKLSEGIFGTVMLILLGVVPVLGCGQSFVGGGGAGGGGAGTTSASGGAGGGSECSGVESEACYSGPAGTQGVGLCKAGFRTCQNGTWGPCKDEKVPVDEVCDSKDNDCNGKLDDDAGCTCTPGAPCFPFDGTPGEGMCQSGTSVCEGDSLKTCEGAVGPVTETCNGFDDDCDGAIDDVAMLGDDCETGLPGICHIGQWHCNLEQMALDCPPPPDTPLTEECNDLDDDCNGIVDDITPVKCDLQVEPPMGGTVSCKGVSACDAGQNVCKPKVFIRDDFSSPNPGQWVPGPGWSIGVATMGPPPDQGVADPGVDATAMTNDNTIAGSFIGGNEPGPLTPVSYFTSKPVDTSNWETLHLSYQRWLNTLGPDERPHTIEASKDGIVWQLVWTNQNDVFDNEWTPMTHNISGAISTGTRFRFGFANISAQSPSVSGWNLDDIELSTCPPGMLPN